MAEEERGREAAIVILGSSPPLSHVVVAILSCSVIARSATVADPVERERERERERGMCELKVEEECRRHCAS
ncbi:uncharacterized protein DS421_14g459000 [Arachis hypogaea]|nr:uncharacterized protein DS421_14g459000 [Arachis hypogaea]